MLRKKKSFNPKGIADERYVLALRDRTLEEEKFLEFKKKSDLVSHHLRDEILKWQKSEVRAFDKKHLSFNEEKYDEIEPYQHLEFDTLADVIALGTAQLNLQKVLAIQSQLANLYEEELEILDTCIDRATEEKQSLIKSFMSSINDSPYLLNTKRNFDNQIKHEQLKLKLSDMVLTATELKEKIAEHSKVLKAEKVFLDEERKILFNEEVITEQSAIERLKPIYQQVSEEDTKLNEQLVIYNQYEKPRLQKEKIIEERSVERLALEFRAIYGGVTGVNSSATASSLGNGSTSANNSNSTASTGNTTAPSAMAVPPAPISSPQISSGNEPTDFEHLSEAVAIYEREVIDYEELTKFYQLQEKALNDAVNHAKAETTFLREGRVLKSYAYYDEIAKQWYETNNKIEKIRKNIGTIITAVNNQDKKIAVDSNHVIKSFKAITDGLPNKRAVYRFLHSDAYQTLLQSVKQPIQRAKELHTQRNLDTERYQKLKQEKEPLIDELLHHRDEVMESMNNAKKVYHRYQKALESYDTTIKALDQGKAHGGEQLANAMKLLSLLEEEQKQLVTIQALQKEEEISTQQSIQKIEILEDRIEVEKRQAAYRTAFGGIILGGGSGMIEELQSVRSLRDKNQTNVRTVRAQQTVIARSRLFTLLQNKSLKLKLLCKQPKTSFQLSREVLDEEFDLVEPERKCVTKTKVVYQIDENVSIHSQFHLEKARKVLPSNNHSSAYALVFLPYRGKIAQTVTAPIPIMSTANHTTATSTLPVERIARRKSTSIEPGIVSKMKRTHSRLARKGSTKNMFYEDDDHSESGITIASNNSTLGNMLASSNGSGSSQPQSDYSKEIQSIEATLQKLYRYEQELISDNMKVMSDVSNILQTSAGKRLLENKEEKWLQKVFFPETELEEIIAKFELLSLFPPEYRVKKWFPFDIHREENNQSLKSEGGGGIDGERK